MSERNFEIKPINENETEAILQHLRKNFFLDEPCSKSIGMSQVYLEGGKLESIETFCRNLLKENISLKAVSASDEIVGVALNATVHRNRTDQTQYSGLFSNIVNLLDVMERGADTFNKNPNLDKLLDLTILSVDSNWRGLGLGTSLIRATKKLAATLGYQLIRIDCTSALSAKAAVREGFQKVYSLNYSDYLHPETKKPIFNPSSPHTTANVLEYKL